LRLVLGYPLRILDTLRSSRCLVVPQFTFFRDSLAVITGGPIGYYSSLPPQDPRPLSGHEAHGRLRSPRAALVVHSRHGLVPDGHVRRSQRGHGSRCGRRHGGLNGDLLVWSGVCAESGAGPKHLNGGAVSRTSALCRHGPLARSSIWRQRIGKAFVAVVAPWLFVVFVFEIIQAQTYVIGQHAQILLSPRYHYCCILCYHEKVGLAFPVLRDKFGAEAVFVGFAGVCALAWAFVHAFVPETKGKALEDLDIAVNEKKALT